MTAVRAGLDWISHGASSPPWIASPPRRCHRLGPANPGPSRDLSPKYVPLAALSMRWAHGTAGHCGPRIAPLSEVGYTLAEREKDALESFMEEIGRVTVTSGSRVATHWAIRSVASTCRPHKDIALGQGSDPREVGQAAHAGRPQPGCARQMVQCRGRCRIHRGLSEGMSKHDPLLSPADPCTLQASQESPARRFIMRNEHYARNW